MSGGRGESPSIVTLFFGEKNLDQSRPVCWSSVVREKRIVGSPFFWSFLFDCIPKATKDVKVHFFGAQ